MERLLELRFTDDVLFAASASETELILAWYWILIKPCSRPMKHNLLNN